MSKFLFFLIFIFSSLFSAEKSNWTHQHSYKLKKDELVNMTIGTQISKGEDKNQLTFRWTLLVGDRVTVLVNHKGYPTQHILYNKRSLDKIKFDILADGANRLEDRSYLFIVLSKIDKAKKEIDFDVFVKDDKKRILISFEQSKEK